MANMFRPTDIANEYGIPVKTAYNWSKESDSSWRKNVYRELERSYARKLAKQAITYGDKKDD